VLIIDAEKMRVIHPAPRSQALEARRRFVQLAPQFGWDHGRRGLFAGHHAEEHFLSSLRWQALFPPALPAVPFSALNLNPNGRVTGNGKRTGVKKMATWFAVNRSQDLYQ
jgi:hypothetical protein